MNTSIKISNIRYLNSNMYEIQINFPKESNLTTQAVKIEGFVYRKDNTTIQELECSSNALFNRQIIGSILLQNSPGFLKMHPNYKVAENARFNTTLHPAFLQKNDKIIISAVMKEGKQEPILSFDIETMSNIQSVYEEKLSPVKLLSLGRTGTTLFMNMISTHPKVGINNYFNESNISSYYLNTIKYSYPTIQKNNFGEGKANLKNIETIEKNEFMEFPFISNDNWYSELYPKKLISFAKSNIDDYYFNANNTEISHFIEKGVVHDPTLSLMDQLYENPKYIFLVRDFRDMYLSIINFNKKRGFRAFGMENYERDEDYIISLGKYCENSFINAYEALKDGAILVKYEDLVSNKKATLKLIFDYLELDSSDIILNEVIEKNNGDKKDEQKHMTTSNVNKSIGRYKESLDDTTIDLLNKSFYKSLIYFGYEV